MKIQRQGRTVRPHKHAFRRSLLASAVIMALSPPGMIWAQQETDLQPKESETEGTQGDGSRTSNEQAAELDVITVTAQRRSQNILDVPYNISAVDGSEIEDNEVLDTAELMRRIPGVGVIDRGPRNSNVVSGIRIRGLNVDSSALGDYAVGAHATVATYVDNTPLFANFLLSDIERVEVLRGPQGTLYGSGALGGAVRYIMSKPELGRFSGRASASLSSVKHSGSIGKSGSVTLNVPFTESLAMRFNATLNRLPGVTDYRNVYVLDSEGIPVAPEGVLSPTAEYRIKKDADSVDQSYGRASLLWAPNDRFDLTLSYMAQSDDFGGRRGTSLGVDGFGVAYGDLEVGSVQLEPADRHVNLSSLEANIDLGFATLTSSSSYYHQKGDITSENTGFYAQNGWLSALYYNYPRPMASAVRGYGDRAFIQELRLVSEDYERFNYVLGAFHQDQDRRSEQDSYLRGFKQWWDAAYPAFTGAVVSDNDFIYRQKESFQESALYGEFTWHLTDTVDFTGGFRYFRDKTNTSVHHLTGLYSSIRDGSDSSTHESDTRALFKGNLSWAFAEQNLLYVTVSEGYRRGGTNGTPTVGNYAEDPAWTSYRPDQVINYDFGVKGRVASTTYDASVFYVDWKDPQINSSTTNWGFFAVQNMGKARTQGVELSMASSIGSAFRYALGYTWTDSELTEDAMGADNTYLIAPRGTRLPGTPEHRFNASGSYDFKLGSGNLTLRGDAYVQSSSENSLSQSPSFQYRLPGHALLNASATYSKLNWGVTLWVKNITNRAAINGVYTTEYMGTSPEQHYFGDGSKALVALPRTVGLTFRVAF